MVWAKDNDLKALILSYRHIRQMNINELGLRHNDQGSQHSHYKHLKAKGHE
jgi:hypothetical protein